MILLAVGCLTAEPEPASEHIVVEDVALEADGLVVHMAQATVTPQGDGEGQQVTATQDGEDRPPLQIEADRTDWRLAERTATFRGNVVAERADVVLSCQELTVHFGDGQTVDRATATGRVRIEHGDRRASGQHAELEGATGKLTLTGDPRLEEGPHVMRGERIVLWMDDERIECQKCRLVVDGAALGQPGSP